MSRRIKNTPVSILSILYLKDHLQTELDLTLEGRRAGDHAGIRQNAAVLTKCCQSRQIKVRMIQNVEKLRTELDIGALSNLRVLDDREVQIEKPRTSQDIAA